MDRWAKFYENRVGASYAEYVSKKYRRLFDLICVGNYEIREEGCLAIRYAARFCVCSSKS